MADEKKEHKEPEELSFGKQMTSLLIVKDMRSKPKEILKGVAFLAFVCFFVFSAFARSCQPEQPQEPEENRISLSTPMAKTWEA